jgi:hypothetical protein
MGGAGLAKDRSELMVFLAENGMAPPPPMRALGVKTQSGGGCFAQTAVIAKLCGERVKST